MKASVKTLIGAVIVPILAGAGMTTALHAQWNGGASSTQYAYCAQFSDGSSADCGFSTLQMCEQSVSGVGGVCLLNPAGPPSAGPLNQNMSAIPPPVAPPSGPLQLPGASQQQLSAPPPPPTPPPCDPLVDGTYCASAAASAGNGPQSLTGIDPIQSLSSDLAIGNPPATLGAINFSGNGSTCIGLFRWASCGGS